MKALNLVGLRFGKLLVKARLESRKGASWWACECDCGGGRDCIGSKLVDGRNTCCGCEFTEHRSTGHATHGMTSHRLFTVWWNMMARCYKTKVRNYAGYGGRGITVCARWHDVRNFIADMDPSFFEGGTIERKDNNCNYEPLNCKWATNKEQSRNKRTTVLTEDMVERAQEIYRTTEFSQRQVGFILGGVSREAMKHVLRGIRQ